MKNAKKIQFSFEQNTSNKYHIPNFKMNQNSLTTSIPLLLNHINLIKALSICIKNAIIISVSVFITNLIERSYKELQSLKFFE